MLKHLRGKTLMDSKLARYLQALNLTPIWLKKKADPAPSLLQKNNSKTSLPNPASGPEPQAAIKNALPTEPVHASPTAAQASDLNVLQIESRLQLLFFRVEETGKTLQQGDYLFATLAPHFAEQNDPPLSHPQYGRMLQKLLLAVGAQKTSIHPLKAVPKCPLAGALLFSRHFAASPLEEGLKKKGIAHIILDHPLILNRHQFRKKETWDKLKRFNPSA